MKNIGKSKFRAVITGLGILGILLILCFCTWEKTASKAGPALPESNPFEQNDIASGGLMRSSESRFKDNYFERIPADESLLQKYRELNGDVVAVITIRDSILRHPVVQSPEKGEGFYLYHDLNLKPNSHGVPFLTLESDLSGDGGNAIIYGHNIIWTKPQDIFCDLVNYEDIDYYKEHPVIEIITEKGTAKYLIFSYALLDTSDPDAFVYWENTDWESEEEFRSYMEKMERRNWLDVNIPYSSRDSFLTISTCSKELAHSGTNRMVIMAKRLAVGEDYEIYTMNAEMRKNPYLPEKLRE